MSNKKLKPVIPRDAMISTCSTSFAFHGCDVGALTVE
jgi:hypothetical protein